MIRFIELDKVGRIAARPRTCAHQDMAILDTCSMGSTLGCSVASDPVVMILSSML